MSETAYAPDRIHIRFSDDGDYIRYWSQAQMTPDGMGAATYVRETAPALQAPAMVEALGSLLDGDLTYDGAAIVITCASHSDAIRRAREARAVLARTRGQIHD